jgi:putative alpha-1,2-mannosidase
VSYRPSLAVVVVGTVLMGSLMSVGVVTPVAAASVPALVSDPASLVNPFAGTGSTPVAKGNPGNVGEFPGADLPFGMISGVRTPRRTASTGSGYSYADSHISGFSLTHMSGTAAPATATFPCSRRWAPSGPTPPSERSRSRTPTSRRPRDDTRWPWTGRRSRPS